MSVIEKLDSVLEVTDPSSLGLIQGPDDIPRLQSGNTDLIRFPAGSWPEVTEALAGMVPSSTDDCVWTYDDDPHAPMWTSPCGVTYSFTEGGPEDNGHKFCHSCGKPLTLAAIDARLASEGGE